MKLVVDINSLWRTNLTDHSDPPVFSLLTRSGRIYMIPKGPVSMLIVP